MSHDHGAHERIEALMRRVEALERRVIFPPPATAPPREFLDHCTKCGLQLNKVMGYVCPNADCPTGLGSPMCFSTGALA